MLKTLWALTLVLMSKAEIDLGSESEEKRIDALFGLHPNELFIEQSQTFNKHDIQKENFNLMALLDRHKKFQTPPHSMEEELRNDAIRDKWERDQECHHSDSCSQNFDYQPVIGIMTQPVSQSKKTNFPYNDYVLEVNDNFIRWAGSRTIAIPFDIPENELLQLLPQINGVLFTGGSLELIDPKTQKQHPYYVTAKKILHYSKFMKNAKGENWPILGICQGLEVISILLANDDPKVLDEIFIYGKNRPVEWSMNSSDTQLWGNFPKNLTEMMANTGLTIHAHSYAVGLETFNKTVGLKKFMKITQTDTLVSEKGNITFIDSMEAKHYPIYTTMYHPEYQLLDFTGKKKWQLVKQIATDEIAFRISLKMNRESRDNTNRIKEGTEQQFMNRYSISRVPAQVYPMITDLDIYAYGYQKQIYS